jgi:tetratricopeptide (TPR) repeat protein
MLSRINVRYLIKVLVVLAVVVVGVHVVYRLRRERSIRALYEQAVKADEQGNRDRTLRLLTRYVLLVPEDIEARIRRGLILERTARTAKQKMAAAAAFEQIVSVDPERDDVRRRLATLESEAGAWEEASGHLQWLLDRFPDDAELNHLMGRCSEARVDYDKARELYETAKEKSPSYMPAYLSLARLWRDRRLRPTDSSPEKQEDAVISEMLQANKESTEACIARAEYQKESGRQLTKIRDVLLRGLERAPQDPQLLFLAGELAREEKKPGEARDRLEKSLLGDPRIVNAYLALAAVELDEGRRAKAIVRLRKGLNELPRKAELLRALAELLIEKGDSEAARQTLEQLRTTDQHAGVVEYLEARLLARQGQWRQASSLLETTRHLLEDLPRMASLCDLLLGQCYQQLLDDRQVSTFKRAVDADRSNVRARLELASAYLRSGTGLDAAIDEYESLMRLPQPPAYGWILLGQALVLKQLLLPAERQDWEPVLERLELAKKANPEAAEVPILRAEALAARGEGDDAKKAEELLEEAKAKWPEKVELWVAHANLVARGNEPAKWASILDEAKRQLGDRVELRLALIGHSVRLPNAEAAKGLARAAAGWEALPAAGKLELARSSADAYLQIRRLEDAAQWTSTWIQLAPGESRPRLFLFDLALQGDNSNAVAQALEGIRAVEGEGPLWHYAEACRLIWLAKHEDKTGLEDARRHLNEAALSRPRWPRIAVCAGEIDELQGKRDEALEQYRMALEQGERQIALVRKVVKLLFDKQRYREADGVISRMQSVTPISGELQKLAADVAVRVPNPERALQLASQVVPKETEDPEKAVWFGQILRAAGKQDEAEKWFRNAVKLDEKKPDAWEQLVYQLTISKAIEKAEAVIEEAKGKIAPEEAILAVAHCYQLIGRLDEAGRQYQAAVEQDPRNGTKLRSAADFFLQTGQGQSAVPLLRKLLESGLTIEKTDRAWARRGLALALATEGGNLKFQEALRLLEQNRTDQSTEAEELRARAMVWLTRAWHRRDSINALEKLAQSQPLSARENSLLANLYAEEQNWPKARETVQRAMAMDRENIRYLAQHTRIALWAEDWTEARVALNRLEEVSPQAFGVDLLEELREELELSARFAEIAKSYAVAAEKMCQDYVKLAGPKRPEAILTLVVFLARHGKVKEALDECEKASAAGCDPQELASAVLVAVKDPETKEEHLQRAERLLAGVLAKKPVSVPIRLCQAGLCEAKGRYAAEHYAKAEALYRAIIATEGDNVLALNNLAFLLAFRGGRHTEALELINYAIDVIGPAAEFLDTRALVHMAAGKAEDAIRDLEAARSQQRRSASFSYHLAEAYALAGRKDAMVGAFAEAIKLRLTMRNLHPLEKGRYEKMCQDYEEAKRTLSPN